MKYPKEIMRATELVKMGFSRRMLMRAFNVPKQTFAWRNNPLSKSSTIMFSTTEFEKYRLELVKISKIER
jgi:hypothetical protein